MFRFGANTGQPQGSGAKVAENKSQPTSASVDDLISSIDNARRPIAPKTVS